MREVLISVIALAIVMIGGKLLFGGRRTAPGARHVPSANGTFTLMQPRRNGVLAGATALVPAALLGYLAFQAKLGGGLGFLVPLVAALVALATAGYLFASAARSRVVVRDTGIERIGVFRRRAIGWTAVAKIAFNSAHNWFFLTLSDGSHLWIPADVPGAGDFSILALRGVPPAVLEAAGRDVRGALEDLAATARREMRTSETT